MFERRHLVALSWYQSFFSMAVSSAGIGPTVGQVVSPLVNESALAESIITQLMHVFEWLR